MNYAPIAFFAYKRPDHTLRSLESLAQNAEAVNSELFIFCDAAKRPEDEEAVKKVREVVKRQQWCGKVHLIEQERNMGLSNSIMTGVTDLCERYDRVIVIEDDLVLSPYFLHYMNMALNLYENCPRVMQISGYMYPIQLDVSEDAVFLPFTSTWGWATWKRAWQYFDPNASSYDLLEKDRKLRFQFDLKGSYPYFRMLQLERNGEVDSWGIKWYLSTFMMQGLVLYPVQSVVKNEGFDGSGTNCGNVLITSGAFSEKKIINLPASVDDISISKSSRAVFKYIRRMSQPRLSKLKRYLKRLKDVFIPIS